MEVRDLEKYGQETAVLERGKEGVQASWKSPDSHSAHTDSWFPGSLVGKHPVVASKMTFLNLPKAPNSLKTSQPRDLETFPSPTSK